MTSDSKSNIKFNYLYRDGGNYKVWGHEVFSNPQLLSIEEVEKKIRRSLIDGAYFDPRNWKIKRLKHEDWIPELDHTWNEFESLEFTGDQPNNDFSIDEFLALIRIVKKL